MPRRSDWRLCAGAHAVSKRVPPTFDPREEPGALAAHAGICAGAAGNSGPATIRRGEPNNDRLLGFDVRRANGTTKFVIFAKKSAKSPLAASPQARARAPHCRPRGVI
jgi:hypothetical protein